jgi:hypothetical protein
MQIEHTRTIFTEHSMQEEAVSTVRSRMKCAIRVRDVFTRHTVAFRLTKHGRLVYKRVGHKSDQRACVACYLQNHTLATTATHHGSTLCLKHAEEQEKEEAKKECVPENKKDDTIAIVAVNNPRVPHVEMTPNHICLINHMQGISIEKTDHVKMFAEWKFQSIDTCEDGNGECPCGKKPILYECNLIHRQTGRRTHVGSRCIERFTGQTVLQKLVNMAQRYISEGITLTYHSKHPRYHHQRFVVRGNAKVVLLKTELDLYFDNKVPLFHMGNDKWLLKVAKTPFSRTLVLKKGDVGTYRLKASTYVFNGNTGFCFYMIPMDNEEEIRAME